MKTNISLHIDGKKIFVDQGTTILEAARLNGIKIPTLCYHPRLTPLGHCRICLVSIEGFNKPLTSCDNPVARGMVVTTDSEQLQEMRRTILELLLATHPYEDCLTCVRTGTCELQENSYQYQVTLPGQLERNIPSEKTSDDQYIVRDEEKCILCGRCLQVCRSGPGRFVYSMVGKGVNTRVVPFREGREVSLEEAGCVFCGQCIDVCPVAALTEKDRFKGGREWELKSAPGVCLECSLGCYMERQASGNDFIKVTVPGEGDKVSWLCQKGKFGFLNSREEQKAGRTVLKKAKHQYSESEYNEAVKKTAEKFLSIKEEHGPDALAVVSAGQLSNEENYLLCKLASDLFGTTYLDLGIEKGWNRAADKICSATGTVLAGPTPMALRSADSIMIIGAGLEESHPVAAMAVGQAGRFGDALIIRTDPSPDNLSAWNQIELNPGKDGYKKLFKTLKMLAEGDRSVLKGQETGLEVDKIDKMTSSLKLGRSYSIICPSFLAESDHDTIDTLIAMLEAFGQIEKGRSNVLLLSAKSNAPGAYTVKSSYASKYIGKESGNFAGKDGEEVISAIKSGKIKGLLLFGLLPAALKTEKVKFIVAVSANPEDAPPNADYIYPAQSPVYKNGLFTNSAGQARFNQALTETAPDLMQDWRFITDLAYAMGVKWSYNSLDDLREEMKGLISR